MIKFKNIAVATLATFMCFNSSMIVYADDSSPEHHSTNLNYKVEESYKWEAPADIVFANNIDTETRVGTVKVLENIIAGDKTLVISIGSNEDFKLTSAESAQRDYEVKKGEEILSAGSRVLIVPSGTNDGQQDLSFELQSVKSGNTSQVAGIYTGTLNFVANIETTGSGNPGGSGSESGGSGGTGGSSGSGGSSTVDMSNVSTTLASGDFSTKGNLVTVNGKSYRVLESNGTQAKLLAMDSYKSSQFNSSSATTSFGGTTGQKYAGSTLDTEMTNFYNSLPAELQNAIVEQNISQSAYKWTGGTNASANFSAWRADSFTDATTSGTNYYLTRTAEINVGARKVFALDVDEVIEYLGSISTPQDVNELFFGVRNSVSHWVWLRSVDSGKYVFWVDGDYGSLECVYYDSNREVRPAFVLDLSLLS